MLARTQLDTKLGVMCMLCEGVGTYNDGSTYDGSDVTCPQCGGEGMQYYSYASMKYRTDEYGRPKKDRILGLLDDVW